MASSHTGTSAGNGLGSEYQVFLSFCGPDTRRGFTNSLYHALVDAGIRVFIDDKDLPPGEKFSGNLLRAIDDSKLYIPIFSPSYASSHWCLRELTKMVKNASQSEEDVNKKVILPIFYNVKPDDVKLKTELYSEAILKLEQKMEDQEKKFSTKEVEMWRWALREVDATQGWELEKYRGDGDLSKMVVNEVVNRLKTRQRTVTKDLVGMQNITANINNLLNTDSSIVQLIGIYGMGGIGKTTLAKVFFNKLCHYYGKNCSFLDNVSETAKTKGLVKLQEQLLSDISNSRMARNIDNIDHGINMIGETICNKKVLIVLDDVGEGNHIQNLIGVNSLYPGTRIFLTTRDKGVLNIKGFKYEIEQFEMEGLSEEDALQLFSRHAFDNYSPPADYYTLSKDIVSTAGGLPLALQAIGSSLFGQEKKKIWEERLEKLLRTPHKDVLGKLRISYDALESDQQQIFLDIACFFIGEDKTNPMHMWNSCGFGPDGAIDVLINRCMIKVLDDDSIWMHDQFRDLGRAIANQEHTRLWATDDIVCELKSTEIKASVQALCLLSEEWIQSPLVVTGEQIRRFPHLRCLWLHNVTCQGDFTGSLSELKWISLRYPHSYGNRRPGCTPRYKATNLHLENAVVVNLFGLGFTEDRVRRLIKGGRKLKVLTFKSCVSIKKAPTFSGYSALKKLTISKCPFLEKIDGSIGELRCLTHLSVESSLALAELPEQIGQLKNLQHLSLRDCGSLSKLPESVSQLESLTKLDLSETGIARLPDSIGELSSLSSLDVSYTPMVEMPETMRKLRYLETLDLRDCHELQVLSRLPRSLTTLRLRSMSLQTVPNLSNLTNLVELLLSDGSEFTETPNIIQTCDLGWIGRLSKLRKQQLCLLNVPAPPTELGSLSNLRELTLNGLDLQTPAQLPPNLTYLELHGTRGKEVHLHGLPQLEELTVKSCKLLERLTITSSLRKLREARVSSCAELVEVQFLGALRSLERICIEDCKSLERLLCLLEELVDYELVDWLCGGRRVSHVSSSLDMLQEFQLWRCPELLEIHFASPLESLEQILIDGCSSLKKLGGLSNLTNLKYLGIVECESLQVVEGMDELKLLHRLKFCGCRSMDRIVDPSSSKLPNECQTQIWDCGKLPDTSPGGSSITFESYREKILNGPTQVSDSEIESIDSGSEDGWVNFSDGFGDQSPTWFGAPPVRTSAWRRPPTWTSVSTPDYWAGGMTSPTDTSNSEVMAMFESSDSASDHHQPDVLQRLKKCFASISRCICCCRNHEDGAEIPDLYASTHADDHRP